jgi:hypothetical protein
MLDATGQEDEQTRSMTNYFFLLLASADLGRILVEMRMQGGFLAATP